MTSSYCSDVIMPVWPVLESTYTFIINCLFGVLSGMLHNRRGLLFQEQISPHLSAFEINRLTKWVSVQVREALVILWFCPWTISIILCLFSETYFISTSLLSGPSWRSDFAFLEIFFNIFLLLKTSSLLPNLQLLPKSSVSKIEKFSKNFRVLIFQSF